MFNSSKIENKHTMYFCLKETLTMRQLSDNQLLHAYEDAVFYELDHNFIIMLREEINRRDLERAESRIIPKSMFKTNNT
ncbi:hypothetical protein COD11_25525 [Bacillus sp. AFS040349]|nr:hypothetical protein COD11_25525 [Bacillus sp. AFS040349]